MSDKSSATPPLIPFSTNTYFKSLYGYQVLSKETSRNGPLMEFASFGLHRLTMPLISEQFWMYIYHHDRERFVDNNRDNLTALTALFHQAQAHKKSSEELKTQTVDEALQMDDFTGIHLYSSGNIYVPVPFQDLKKAFATALFSGKHLVNLDVDAEQRTGRVTLQTIRELNPDTNRPPLRLAKG